VVADYNWVRARKARARGCTKESAVADDGEPLASPHVFSAVEH
jgi:hypothetical protein